MKNIIFLIFMLFLSSCFDFKKQENDVSLPKNEKIVPVEIIKKNSGNIQPIIFKEFDKYEAKFTEKQKKALIDEGIDLEKFASLLKKAYDGDKNSILNCLSLYKKLKFNEKYNELKEFAISKNISEIIYIDAVEKLDKNDFENAKKSIFKLSNDKKYNSIKSLYHHKIAIEYLKNKNYDMALKNLKLAYDYGDSKVISKIAYIYYLENDLENAKKWYKLAYDLGEKNIGYELSVIYFNEGSYEKAIPFLKEQYNLGKKELAYSIGISYYNVKDIKNAIKWVKISADDGNAEAYELLKQIRGKQKGSYDVGE